MKFKNRIILNSKPLHLILALAMLLVVCISSCKYTNQQNEMFDLLEESGVEVPPELREDAGLNWANVIFPVSIVLGFGFIGFFIFRKAKRTINEIGYSMGEMKGKLDATVKDKQLYDKMSQEEREQFDAIQRLFNKKSGQ